MTSVDNPPKQSDAMRAERDRFVALAFCWADFMVEVDRNRKIVFAVGATDPVLGIGANHLVGKQFLDLVAPTDRALATQLLLIAERQGRIENVTVRFSSERGLTSPLNFAGYCLSDLGGHFFLAFRMSATTSSNRSRAAGRPLRDLESGLIEGDFFVEVATDRIESLHRSGHEARVSLLAVSKLDELRERLAADEQENLMRTIGATLRASSVGGDSASVIGEGKFGLVHEAQVDIDKLEGQIRDFTREVDPLGKGVTTEAATVVVDDMDISEEDLANSLMYMFNQFRESKDGSFSLTSLCGRMSELLAEARETVHNFRRIVADSDFDIAFQPIIDAISGDIHHYEGLCRFRGEMGASSPYKYITFAEETGLIWQFDLAMAAKAIDWLAAGSTRKDYSVAVNVSGLSVGTFSYVNELHKLLRKNMWTRGRVLFEITESSRMSDLESADRFIQTLRNEGYTVCLDDFGAGAASFQYLSALDVDVVKLDGSAVRNAQRARKGEAFLSALTKLCHSLKVETIAEMIDNKRGLEFVRKCGVQYVQGYLFGKPSKRIEDFSPLPQQQLFAASKRRSTARRT